MNFNDLPDELLKLILSYVDCRRSQCASAMVCSRWHRLMSDPSTHIDDQLKKIEIFDRTYLETANPPLFGTRYVLHDVDEFLSYANFVETCDRLSLNDIDSPRHAADYRRILQSMESRVRQLEITKSIILGPHALIDLDIIDECCPNLHSLILTSSDQITTSCNRSGRFSSKLNHLQLECANPNSDFVPLENLERLESLSWSVSAQTPEFLPMYNRLTDLTIGTVACNHVYLQTLLASIRDNLFRLNFLRFRDVSFLNAMFESITLPPPSSDRQSAIKNLEFSNCTFLFFDEAVTALKRILDIKLESVSIFAKSYTHPRFEDIFQLISILYAGKARLDFRLKDDADYSGLIETPPSETAVVLRKLELEKVESNSFIETVFRCGVYENLVELTFDRCPGLETGIMADIAHCCVQLQRLQIIRCDSFRGSGFLEFLRHWDVRKSRLLNIRWDAAADPEDDEDEVPSTPMEKLYTDLKKDPSLIDRKRIEQNWKRNGDCRILIWECTEEEEEKYPKALVIRDYERGSTKIEQFILS